MKLILASQGFTTLEIANAVAKTANKPLNALNIGVINEAYTGIKSGQHQGWLINELSLISHHAKGTISFINLRAYDIDEIGRRLEFADVIYIVGGAQLVLPKLFRETGFDTLLKKIVQQKVVMGTSAGANVLGRQIEDANYWDNQYGSSEEYLAQPPLGLVDFNILPHFERKDHPKRTTAIVAPLLANVPFPLYGLSDGQAVIYDNGNLQFVGGTPPTFGRS